MRVIFDTNIYGLLAAESDGPELKEHIQSEKDFIVYGYAPIRREIRNIPKANKLSRRNRMFLLQLYDAITGNHLLPNSAAINHLAKKYYDYYQHLGGSYLWETSIKIDFLLVACVSMHRLDVVYSADAKTLMNKTALKAYNHINRGESIDTPHFLKYEELVEKFRKLV